jgi:hypothetical protein
VKGRTWSLPLAFYAESSARWTTPFDNFNSSHKLAPRALDLLSSRLRYFLASETSILVAIRFAPSSLYVTFSMAPLFPARPSTVFSAPVT